MLKDRKHAEIEGNRTFFYGTHSQIMYLLSLIKVSLHDL